MWRFVVPAAGIIAGLVMALSIALRDAPSSSPEPAPLAPAQAPADVVVSAPTPLTPTSSAATLPAGIASNPMPQQRADAASPPPPPPNVAAPQAPSADASVIAGGDLPLDTETDILRRQRDALAAEVQRLQGELDRDQKLGSSNREQEVVATRSNSARARRREDNARTRDASDPGFASVENLLARLRRGSRFQPSPGAAANAAPQATQPTGGDTTAAWEKLTAARHALVTGSMDEARTLLQAARFQLALRPITPDQPEPIPDGRGVARQVGAALSDLDAGRQMQAIHSVDRAIARLAGVPDEQAERGAAPPGTAYAGWPLTRPMSGQFQP